MHCRLPTSQTARSVKDDRNEKEDHRHNMHVSKFDWVYSACSAGPAARWPLTAGGSCMLAGTAEICRRVIHQSEVTVPVEAVTKIPHRKSAFLMSVAVLSPSRPG